MISFIFAGVLTNEEKNMTEGSDGSCLNFINLQGTDKDNMTTSSEMICLYILKESSMVVMEGWSFTVDFHTTNITENQFVVSYKAGICI